jgi:hypothetical protein
MFSFSILSQKAPERHQPDGAFGALPGKCLHPVDAVVEQQQLIAMQFLRSLDQSPHFPLQGLRVRNVGADLDQFRYLQALLDDKIYFLMLRTLPVGGGVKMP